MTKDGATVFKFRNKGILVCDYNRGNVQQFSFKGQFTGKTVDKLQKPVGITTMQDGLNFKTTV